MRDLSSRRSSIRIRPHGTLRVALIPYLFWSGFASTGCGKPARAISDPLPLDDLDGIELGDYVEVRTLDGEHFFGEVIELGPEKFRVDSKQEWSYEGHPVPFGLTGKRSYHLEELASLRLAEPETKWSHARTVGVVALSVVFVGAALFLMALSTVEIGS